MSTTEDINSNKDEADSLNANLDIANMGQMSEGNSVSSEKVDNLGILSNITGENGNKPVTEGSNVESIDNVMDILYKNVSEEANSSGKEKGTGDSTISEDTTIDPVVSEDKFRDEITCSKNDNDTTDFKTKVSDNLSDTEMDEDEDLELRWDDDDGNDLSLENQAEDAQDKDDVGCEDLEKSGKEPESSENKLDSIETFLGIEKAVETNVTKNDSEIITVDKSNEEKDTDAMLEEKLLEEDEEEGDSSEISKQPITDAIEINEDELLKDDTMDVDIEQANDKEANTVDSILISAADISKVEEQPMETEVETNLLKKEKTNSLLLEKEESAPSLPETMPAEKIEQDIAESSDRQEENEEDGNSNNTSSENSPIRIKTDHGLHKPDVMLEIPTQELIDIDDVLDSPNDSKIDDDLVDDSKIDDELVDDSKINTDIVDESKINDRIVDESKLDDELVDCNKFDDAVNETAVKSETTEQNKVVDSLKEANESHEDDMNMGKDSSKENKADLLKAATTDDAQPSTSTLISTMTPDTSNEMPDVSDSLGLLAESSRVRDDDDEQDDDEDGDADDDDESDLDESSNQMTAEHSEESNPPHSESEPGRDEQEKELEERENDIVNKCEEDFEFTLNELGTEEQVEDNVEPGLEIEQVKIGNVKAEELQTNEVKTEEIKTDGINIEQVKTDNVKIEQVKTEGLKTEQVKIEAMKTEQVKIEGLKTEQVKTEGLKTEQVKTEDVKVKQLKQEELKMRESVSSKTEQALMNVVLNEPNSGADLDPKLTLISEEGIKIEQEDSVRKLRPPKKIVNKLVDKKRDDDNDDVIEQIEEIETVKLSDDEDEPPPQESRVAEQEAVEDPQDKQNEKELEQTIEKTAEGELKQIKAGQKPATDVEKPSPKSSPSKLIGLTVTAVTNDTVLNIVELEESSSEDDMQVIQKVPKTEQVQSERSTPCKSPVASTESGDVTTVNIPPGIEIMSTSASGNTLEILVKEGEVVISGVPKPPPQKPARLNTSEVTIKTASTTEQTLVIPETKIGELPQAEAKVKPRLSLEIFSLDSDEEEAAPKVPSPPPAAPTPEAETSKKKMRRCINYMCAGECSELVAADNATAAFYDAGRKRRPLVCRACADSLAQRHRRLIKGIKDMTPLLQLDMSSISQDLVEILDSDSEDEEPDPADQDSKEGIGEAEAEFLEKNLVEFINDAWKKYDLEHRLKDTQDELTAEIQKLEDASKEIGDMLDECQRVTDRVRSDLYATFQHRIQNLPPILIYETPEFNYIGPEVENVVPMSVAETQTRLSAKRKLSANNEMPAKRPAIPLGYAPLDDSKTKQQEPKAIDYKADDDKDISVVKLSVEAAPPDLPPNGKLSRAALRVDMPVYAMKNAFGQWFKARIMEVMPKAANAAYTSCRIKFDHKGKNSSNRTSIVQANCIAYAEPADVRLTIGTRVIALFKDNNKKESYYSGIIAEVPTPVNNFRYMVFFDDGYSQYVRHADTRAVCEAAALVWEEVQAGCRDFVRDYLRAFPERPMVRLRPGQSLKAELHGKWWPCRVTKVDASLAQVVFSNDGRREWVYRGSTRLAPLYLELQAAERHRPRPMPRSKHPRYDMPYVEYTRSDEQGIVESLELPPSPVNMTAQQQNEEIRRQRAVAKKSSSLPSAALAPAPSASLDANTSRVVYYTPKNSVRPYKMVPHKCSPKCKRSDVLALKDLRTYNPLAKPLLSGWERQIVRFKGQKEVMYRAPCGRRVRSMAELHRYLRLTHSDMPVDLFDFYHGTHCLAEFVLNKCLVGKKDLSHGKENVPVPCVNNYDDSLPEFCSYNTERTPTSGVPLNLDPEFLCGCDCTDDCQDKTKCACWKLTLEGARTIGLDSQNVGYEYKRLPEPLPSGIYECNSRCKCADTCLNRVAQHPLQLKLQVFKTAKRGWGIRALNDVPKGAFLCVYAGNLLTDATANLDGLNEGDEYLAELDYIEVVEQMKEGYEEDIPEADKKIAKEGSKQEDSTEEPSSSEEEDETASKTDKEDDDFRPGYIGLGVMEFNKRLRKRSKKKEEKDAADREKEKDKDSKEANADDDCITISDDEEVREPSRFAAQPGMGGDFVSKYKSVRSLFGEDEACYIMDAKVQGNIGRYLNHSCSPNVFVQNVFVDTHDPRFPWVAFFALSHIRAGTELTWNYNYDVGSVPGKVLYCFCEAPNCRGRLL